MKIVNIVWNKILFLRIALILVLAGFAFTAVFAQNESQTATMKLGRLWMGVSANGAKSNFSFTAGYFPNDYDILGNTGTDADAFGGMGLTFAATNWFAPVPADSVMTVAVYGATNDFMPNGSVPNPMQNYIRYNYPDETVDYSDLGITYPGTYDATAFDGHSYDQLIDVTSHHILGVDVHRKIMVWSQNYNDDYAIVDLELTNTSDSTLHTFYVNLFEGNKIMQFSSTRNPLPAPGEFPQSAAATWMHYYGGRVGDTARVFYEYSANTSSSSDNMGAPAISQGGRLMYAQMTYLTILHASYASYTDAANDSDDFAQPKVTYIGNSTRFPNPPSGSDEYGSKNFWTVRGGYSDLYKMDSLNSIPGTHHGENNDDISLSQYYAYHAGSSGATNDQKRFVSFGPYEFAPGQKLHFVYASGVTGIGLKLAKQIGEQWEAGTLDSPPGVGMEDGTKGRFPAKFVFPTANVQDQRKDRWLSLGIDSVFHDAYLAKWNYQHNYNIPQAPPPPSKLTVTGNGDGVVITWSDEAAEEFSNFDGYRIMRRLGNYDTTYYQEIYTTLATDKAAEHTYKDTTAKVGAAYYYYIQSKATISAEDPNADPTTRGAEMYSSRTLIPDVSKSIRRYPFQYDLSKIRVVPNPVNISDPKSLQDYGWNSSLGFGLLFINLPPDCWIRIYTENGDLVKENHFDEPVKNGLWFWDMVTRSQQVINSGVYIALFQTPDGAVGYQKFVVVN